MASSVIQFANTDPYSGLSWQQQAWRFYGDPDLSLVSSRSNCGAVGEVRFTLGWAAHQISRLGWGVKIDGEQLDQDDADAMMATVYTPGVAQIIALNMLVAGEVDYMAFTADKARQIQSSNEDYPLAGPLLPRSDDGSVWMPVASIDPRRKKRREQAELKVRGIWPHPADITVPDPPLKGVLDVLAEIEQLQDVAWAHNRSRIAQMGIMLVAQELEEASTLEGGAFTDHLEELINAPIRDPRSTSASPIMLRGPGDLIASGSAIDWTQIGSGDLVADLESRMKFAIQRLAWGFPVPPEVLLGMTATNRATAFQIEQTTYESHIKPVAEIVGRVFATALGMLQDGDDVRVEVTPDATEILARRHSVADAFQLYDRGLVSADYVREVTGVDPEDASTAEDIERIRLLSTPGGVSDPAETAANEAVAGSGMMRAEALAAAAQDDRIDLDEISANLDRLDRELRESLAGAADIAIRETFRRIGARARDRNKRAELVDPDLLEVSNVQVPSVIGPDQLEALEVNPLQIAASSFQGLRDWWLTERLPKAQRERLAILDHLGVMLEDADMTVAFEASAERLFNGVVSQVLGSLGAWPVPEVDTGVLFDALTLAGGGELVEAD